MSTYESDPAGLGIGKRYGDRGIGGTVGEFIQDGALREVVFELQGGEPVDAATLTTTLPAGYLIDSIVYEVETIFAGTTPGFTVTIGGGTASTENALGVAIPATAYTAGSITNLSSVTAKDLVLTLDAAGLASATGKATVVVAYKVV
jgi:hypothetical protein